MTSPALIKRLMYMCSHELRGPICTIRGLVKLVEDHPQAVDIYECLQKIDECNRKMDRIIHSLQEFIAIEDTLVHDFAASSAQQAAALINNCTDSGKHKFGE